MLMLQGICKYILTNQIKSKPLGEILGVFVIANHINKNMTTKHLIESTSLVGTYPQTQSKTNHRVAYSQSGKQYKAFASDKEIFTPQGVTDHSARFYIISPKRAVKDLRRFISRQDQLDLHSGEAMATDDTTKAFAANLLLKNTLAYRPNDNEKRDAIDFCISSAGSKYFNVTEVKGLDKLYLSMTTRHNMHDSMFTALFNEDPSIFKGNLKERVGSFNVLWQSDMRQSIKDGFIEKLMRAEEILSRFGLAHICDVDVEIGKIKSKTSGLYYSNLDIIKLSVDFAKNRRSVYTLVHELGHRLHLQNPSIDAEVLAKHQEVFKTAASAKRGFDVYAEAIEPYASALYNDVSHERYKRESENIVNEKENDPNSVFKETHLIYTGRASRKQLLSKGSRVHVCGEYNKLTMISEKAILKENSAAWTLLSGTTYPFIPATGSFSLSMSSALHQEFMNISGRTMPNPIELNDGPFLEKFIPEVLRNKYHFNGNKAIRRDEWVVTEYAEVNYKEFFAEIFVNYVMGKLKGGEPKEWIKRIIRMG